MCRGPVGERQTIFFSLRQCLSRSTKEERVLSELNVLDMLRAQHRASTFRYRRVWTETYRGLYEQYIEYMVIYPDFVVLKTNERDFGREIFKSVTFLLIHYMKYKQGHRFGGIKEKLQQVTGTDVA